MIQSIYVKNFILIDELSLDFDSSFSVFTGETGAGKSLFIDALSVLCGARVSINDIQHGQEEALIEAQFLLKGNHPSAVKLKESGYELEDGVFVVSRVFNREGKSIAKINNRPTTLAFIKEIMSQVVDIHSQHDSQYLLNNKNHLHLLDQFCNDSLLLLEVKQAYKDYHTLHIELDKMEHEDFNADDLDYYKFQLNEIESLAIQENELEQLEATQKEMGSYEKRSAKITKSLEMLRQSNYEVLYELQKELSNMDSEVLDEVSNEFANAYYLVEEQEHKLDHYLSSLEFDEEMFQANQQRIFDLNNIVRKHGHSLKDVFDKQAEIQNKITMIDDRDAYLNQQKLKVEVAYKQFNEKAQILSEKRKKAAQQLELEIQTQLADLHLNNALFKIMFDEDSNQYGIDKVEFYISMNKGEVPRSLSKVISGGELSRLMLGLKTIFTKLQHIETIVFDEIDTGVSGNVAYAIGKKMQRLSKDTQVISITHLAPVAAWGSDHFLVSKQENNNKTTSAIHRLDVEARIHELAGIASNSNSETALIAAKELYDSCRNDIN